LKNEAMMTHHEFQSRLGLASLSGAMGWVISSAMGAGVALTVLEVETAPTAYAQGADALVSDEPTSFLGWCQQKQSFPPETQLTIDQLLERAGTTNCAEANQRLRIRTLLDLGVTGISDLRPLSSLTGLRQLVLFGNEISDLSPLSSLENLTSLQLGYNSISDVTPLAPLTNLTLLGLIENDISDVTPLASLSNVQELRLTSNEITDISPLSELTELQRLYLNNNQITDIAPLGRLTKLDILNVSGNQIRNADVLNQLPELDEVFLFNNPIPSNVCPANPDLLCLPRG
jgi:internalin A